MDCVPLQGPGHLPPLLSGQWLFFLPLRSSPALGLPPFLGLPGVSVEPASLLAMAPGLLRAASAQRLAFT